MATKDSALQVNSALPNLADIKMIKVCTNAIDLLCAQISYSHDCLYAALQML